LQLHSLQLVSLCVCVGYKPCSPQLVSDRILHLTAAYEELLQLANERQSRLKEARKMWQFYDDVEDEEAWIKEKEQIMSSPDLGHDLTSIRLLLTKHKVQCFVICLLGVFLEWLVLQTGEL